MALERMRGAASNAQHIAHKAVFDATAEALLAELAPVRQRLTPSHFLCSLVISLPHAEVCSFAPQTEAMLTCESYPTQPHPSPVPPIVPHHPTLLLTESRLQRLENL